MLFVVEIVLWVSLACVVYCYALYPVLLAIAARVFGRRNLAPSPAAEPPRVAVLISALNEEVAIGERLKNILEQDYSPTHLCTYIASDGSTDRTAAIVASYAKSNPQQVHLLDFPARRGKATVLNSVVPTLDSEIVVFSDANTFFDTDAVHKLIRWFSDPNVGIVCGKLLLIDPKSGKNVDGLYWKYENFLKEREGRLGALLGANGAIYALRKSDYVPIAGDTIVDDYTIPLLSKLRSGKRIVYDAEAIAREETPPRMSDEFRRRSRIGAGGFQSLYPLRRLLLPTNGWLWFTFVSHKLLRWFCPFFLIAAFLANLCLVGHFEYRILFALQACFYVVSLLGVYWPGSGSIARLVRLCAMFTSMNLALLAGFGKWVRGIRGGTWQRTAR